MGRFLGKGLSSWDVAAAGLIAEESGLSVTSYTNDKFNPFDSSIVVGNSVAHKELISLINNN